MAVTLGRCTPVLRSFDESKAREFYVDWLGFAVDWEHRFEPDLPLYLQVSRSGLLLHLSELTPPWGGLELTVVDPAGNRLTFHESA